MATWGEFMQAFKITNMKGTVYVHADQVLDVWEERNKLRDEVEQLRLQLAAERERCAQDVEEFAAACAAEPDQPEYVARVLQVAAELIRQRAHAAEEAPPAEDAAAAEETAPEASPVDDAGPIATEPIPSDDTPSVEDLIAGAQIPPAGD